MTKKVQVAVAVIEDATGRVLLSRRPEGVHQGGLWEFPGGKLEPGESLGRALRREIREELGLNVIAHRPLIRIVHRYPERTVLLDVHRVTEFSGVPEGREGQPLAWCLPGGLSDYPMPAADRPVISALRLPPAYVITDPCPGEESAFLAQAEKVLQQGHRLIQFRAPGMERARYRSLARKLVQRCRLYDASLLLNAPVEEVSACAAQGVHLDSRRLMSLEVRPLPPGSWVGASCHNEEELSRAAAIGVDFVVLSPVMATPSHPHARTLGWEGFRRMVEEAPFPVYALGGMTPAMLGQAQEMGGQGIAAIRGLWKR